MEVFSFFLGKEEEEEEEGVFESLVHRRRRCAARFFLAIFQAAGEAGFGSVTVGVRTKWRLRSLGWPSRFAALLSSRWRERKKHLGLKKTHTLSRFEARLVAFESAVVSGSGRAEGRDDG